MIKKTFIFCLLPVTFVTLGCERPQPAMQSATAAKEQSTPAAQAEAKKPPASFQYEIPASSTSQTPNMTPYHWPAAFKLPLIIKMVEPPVPKEIQNPSPPIEEKKEDEKK